MSGLTQTAAIEDRRMSALSNAISMKRLEFGDTLENTDEEHKLIAVQILNISPTSDSNFLGSIF
jgi:hypothetical protein